MKIMATKNRKEIAYFDLKKITSSYEKLLEKLKQEGIIVKFIYETSAFGSGGMIYEAEIEYENKERERWVLISTSGNKRGGYFWRTIYVFDLSDKYKILKFLKKHSALLSSTKIMNKIFIGKDFLDYFFTFQINNVDYSLPKNFLDLLKSLEKEVKKYES
jgi:hypothetical protein